MLRAQLAVVVGAGLTACQPAPPTETPAAKPPAAPTELFASAAEAPAGLAGNREPVGAAPAADTLQAVRAFLPAGYRVLDANTGNLNRDAYPDRVLVLDTTAVATDSTYEEDNNHIKTAHRPLLLLLGQLNGRYRLAARNDNTVLCADCGGLMGDPYQDVIIKNGYFSVEHYGGSAWRWTHILTFKYNPADHHWYLHRAGSESFHATDPDKVKTHVETVQNFGKVRFEDYTGDRGWAK